MWPTLRFFAEAEFRHPERMDVRFLNWLDTVRAVAGVPFRVTSDARTPAENARVGGAGRSLHLQGRAIDFVPPVWNATVLWQITHAATLVPPPEQCGVELELVQSDTDRHIHLGLFPDARSSRLVLALD